MNAKRLWISLILIVILSLTSHALPASAGESPQEIYVWAFFRKADWYDDPFYRERVLVYKVGDAARIDVVVYNPYYTLEFSIIKVSIRFDWMPRDEFIYSEDCSREDPYVLKPHEWAVFLINVEIPDKPGINELPHVHDVSIVALEDMEEQIVGREIGIYIAVYSQEQAEAVALYERLSQRLGLSPLSLRAPYAPAPTFTTSEANVLARRASILAMDGLEKYKKGEFTAAKDDFLVALELFDRALKVESERGRAVEEAVIRQADAAMIEANAAKTQADAAKIQADAQAEHAETVRQLVGTFAVLAWGLTAGTILIGVGVIIYVVRGFGLKKRTTTS